jgi:transcriptional regulator with XRE-family HTH domain
MGHELNLHQRDFLKQAMTQLGVTREGLSQRIGVSVKTVNKWMSPKDSNEFRVMPTMARYYVNDILTGQISNSCNTPYGGIQSTPGIHKRGNKMHLRQRILDAVLDGKLGTGVVVTRPEVMAYFPEINKAYTGVVLSNAEMDTGSHSPTWEHYTHRIARGVYRVSPTALAERLRERHDADAESIQTEYPDPSDGSDEAIDQRFQAFLNDPKT